MKPRYAAVAVAAASGVSAQAPAYGVSVTVTPSTSSPAISSAPVSAVTPPASQSYVTVTYDDCPSSSIATMITVTNGVTVTYCPECDHGTSPAKTPIVPHTTVYTTVYQSLCPTGLVPATYTITESCTDATPTWATHSTAIPPGFTVTVKTCDQGCAKTPVPVTITEPCGCEATSGVPATQTNPATTGTPAPPAAPPASASATGSIISQISDGTFPEVLSFVSHTDSVPLLGQIQAPAGTPAPATGGSAPPYPTGNSNCPGPQCRAVASNAPVPPSNGSTEGITPYTGAASSFNAGVFASLTTAIAIGVLAMAL